MIYRILVLIMKFLSQSAYAQVGSIPVPTPGDEPPRLELLIDSLLSIINKIGPVVGLFGFCMIIYGGYLWIVSGGDPQKKQRAQATLTWSIIGVGFFYLIRMLLDWVLNWFVQ